MKTYIIKLNLNYKYLKQEPIVYQTNYWFLAQIYYGWAVLAMSVSTKFSKSVSYKVNKLKLVR